MIDDERWEMLENDPELRELIRSDPLLHALSKSAELLNWSEKEYLRMCVVQQVRQKEVMFQKAAALKDQLARIQLEQQVAGRGVRTQHDHWENHGGPISAPPRLEEVCPRCGSPHAIERRMITKHPNSPKQECDHEWHVCETPPQPPEGRGAREWVPPDPPPQPPEEKRTMHTKVKDGAIPSPESLHARAERLGQRIDDLHLKLAKMHEKGIYREDLLDEIEAGLGD